MVGEKYIGDVAIFFLFPRKKKKKVGVNEAKDG